MTHAKSNLRSASLDGAATTDEAKQHEFGPTGSGWRSALGRLAGVPLRLHQYRNFHAEVVEDALRAYDSRRCS